MTSQQYEELCRHFIATQLGLALEQVRSLWLAGPQRERPSWCGDSGPSMHQIDLYWETANAVARYLNIVNAKWRSADKVQFHDVLLLHQVKQQVGAHKAILITNTGFTHTAYRAAEDQGTGLLILRPQFDARGLPATDRDLIQRRLQQLAGGKPLCSAQPLCKGLGTAVSIPQFLGQVAPPSPSLPYLTRTLTPTPAPPSGPANRGPNPSASPATGQSASTARGYLTKQGPGAGFLAK